MSITVTDLDYTYMAGTPYEKVALKDINISFEEGSFIGIIGHTGSGKSTLIQHLNGLLKPQKGKVMVDGQDIWEKGYKRSAIRQKIGLVFQYPEHQLFEETVLKEIAFGPANMGLEEQRLESRVKWALELVGLPYSKIKDLSPFDLSGGQRRRLAIAGVLAMRPKYLVLDEPTAGLDPKGKKEILDQVRHLHKEHNITIILVSHSMEDVARLADRVVVMDKGRIDFSGTPREVFNQGLRLKEIGLGLPSVASLMVRLKEKGWPIESGVFTVEDAEREILKAIRGN